MVRNIQGNWAKLSAIVLGMSISEVALAAKVCTVFPRDSANPIVEACELDTEYRFRIGDENYQFAKDIFRDQIRQATIAWLADRDLESSVSEVSAVEIWLSVPESNPLAAQARAVVSTARGNIVFSFDVKSNDWTFGDEKTAILNHKTYPESFGHRPSRILATAFAGVSAAAVIDSLMDSGAISVRSEGNDNYSAVCKPFEEISLAQNAAKSHSDVFRNVQVNSVYEWIADRQIAFRFLMDQETH